MTSSPSTGTPPFTGPPFTDPPPECPLCPRLVQFRLANRQINQESNQEANHDATPPWHNAPVASFGGLESRLLVVGLAPGLKGANRTGRPFTGDYAGDLLYAGLEKFGFSSGTYDARADDALTLVDCRITNAVRCVPPENKPTAAETTACRPFLESEIAAMPNLRVLMALGKVAHDAVIRTFGLKLKDFPFGHGAIHALPNGLTLTDSYHCSRYNTQTKRLTREMFFEVLAGIRTHLG